MEFSHSWSEKKTQKNLLCTASKQPPERRMIIVEKGRGKNRRSFVGVRFLGSRFGSSLVSTAWMKRKQKTTQTSAPFVGAQWGEREMNQFYYLRYSRLQNWNSNWIATTSIRRVYKIPNYNFCPAEIENTCSVIIESLLLVNYCNSHGDREILIPAFAKISSEGSFGQGVFFGHFLLITK